MSMAPRSVASGTTGFEWISQTFIGSPLFPKGFNTGGDEIFSEYLTEGELNAR